MDSKESLASTETKVEEMSTFKYWYNVIFNIVWLLGWAMGWAVAIYILINQNENLSLGALAFFLIWGGGWAFFGFLTIRNLIKLLRNRAKPKTKTKTITRY